MRSDHNMRCKNAKQALCRSLYTRLAKVVAKQLRRGRDSGNARTAGAAGALAVAATALVRIEKRLVRAPARCL